MAPYASGSEIKAHMTSGFSGGKADVDLMVGNHIFPCFNYEHKESSEPLFSPLKLLIFCYQG